ncbi:TPA: hypothetical protein ACG4NT_000159 [Stenotrophomonas maltophilia]|uniref:hypothetical protein n=1 Tax=Stenotrophomonas TaxID=40323 RepID=UPI00111E8B09|nr:MULTISPECIES: hypothetical protein [Stenotrophomonas]WNF11715.1 hypothetical protein RKE57_06135 [Stenotrophomonas geniculata]
MSNMEERFAEIERRLALLEARNAVPAAGATGNSSGTRQAQESVVSIAVSNKRYDHGDYEDHIWFDCDYTLSEESKPTRAVKGTIEFMDLFGEVKFRLNVTVNSPMSPGRPLANPGIGFTFNQFMPEHQWMLTTDLHDMQIKFVASNMIYSDGTSQVLA